MFIDIGARSEKVKRSHIYYYDVEDVHLPCSRSYNCCCVICFRNSHSVCACVCECVCVCDGSTSLYIGYNIFIPFDVGSEGHADSGDL